MGSCSSLGFWGGARAEVYIQESSLGGGMEKQRGPRPGPGAFPLWRSGGWIGKEAKRLRSDGQRDGRNLASQPLRVKEDRDSWGQDLSTRSAVLSKLASLPSMWVALMCR